MNRDLLDRVILPVGIPLAAFVLIEIAVVSLSRVFISLDKIGAALAALGVAIGILVAASLVAASRRMRSSTIVGLVVVAGLAVVAGGIWGTQQGPAALEGHEEESAEGHAEGGAPEGGLTIVAENIQFDTDELSVPAGEEVSLTFDNQDAGVPHNVAIYEDDSTDEELFVGEIFDGVAEMTYEIPPMEAGSYYFHCDVHPNMNGTVGVG